MRVPRPLVFWIVALAAAYAPALLAPGPLYGQAGGLAELTPEQRQAVEGFESESVVRLVYETFTKFSKAGGTPVDFELSDFELVLAPRFGEYSLREIFLAVPLGRVIRATLNIYEYIPEPGIKHEGANIVAHWDDGAGMADENVPEYLEMATSTAAADFLLEHLDDEDLPVDFTAILGIVRYKVFATLDGESRTYRAALIINAGKPGEIVANVNDMVVENLDSNQLFSMEPVPTDFLEKEQSKPVLGGEAGGAQCWEAQGSAEFSPLLSSQGTDEHSTGKHYSAFKLRSVCSTTGDCKSMCAPSIATSACWDNGTFSTFGTIHKAASSKTQSAKAAAAGGKSHCGAALGCGIRSCIFSCGLSGNVTFSKSGVGAGVSLTSNGADFALDQDYGVECAGAKPLIPACPPGEVVGCGSATPGDPSTGGGVTGGATNFCTWTCAARWNPNWGNYLACDLICTT